MTDAAISELRPVIGVKAACAALGRPRATHYRWHRQSPAPARAQHEAKPQPRALSPAERTQVLEVLNCERFRDLAPGEVYAILLDEGTYLCSEATMYRILREQDQVHERRAQATHPARVKPELVAREPNQCWSWDITKLAGPAKWTYYYLYTIIDKAGAAIPFRPNHGHEILSDIGRDLVPGYPLISRMRGLAELRGIASALALAPPTNTSSTAMNR